MKTLILFIVLIFTFSILTNAQEVADNTIGLRLGDADGLGAEISYQKGLTGNNRLEFGLSWRNNSFYNAYKLVGTYQWVFELDQNFNWYVGAGGGLGSWNVRNNFIGDSGVFLLVAGDIGIEYKFDFPLLLSLDFRPEIGFANFNSGLGLDIALGARYTFD
ncbi:MAG: hypothetical protein L3J23_08435 [Flavobacteriaceae bacterium]|nr:hypothetical protein [Flavobacteriaceae bacterium]